MSYDISTPANSPLIQNQDIETDFLLRVLFGALAYDDMHKFAVLLEESRLRELNRVTAHLSDSEYDAIKSSLLAEVSLKCKQQILKNIQLARQN
jgi:hypothetical protein